MTDDITEFEDFLALKPPLRLPYGGRVYEIPPIGINDAIVLHLALDPDSPDDNLPGNKDLERMLLGDAAARMRVDNVEPAFVMRALLTALADFQQGRTVAHTIWKTGADPKALEAWIGEHVESALSSSTAEATATPSPASTTGTKTSRPKRTGRTATASPGGNS